jgi:hypothetical protein
VYFNSPFAIIIDCLSQVDLLNKRFELNARIDYIYCNPDFTITLNIEPIKKLGRALDTYINSVRVIKRTI